MGCVPRRSWRVVFGRGFVELFEFELLVPGEACGFLVGVGVVGFRRLGWRFGSLCGSYYVGNRRTAPTAVVACGWLRGWF